MQATGKYPEMRISRNLHFRIRKSIYLSKG